MLSVPPPDGSWVPFAHLIRQDLAANLYPFLNGSNQTVALVDRGVDYNLPELGGGVGRGFKVIGGANFRPGDDPTIILDDYGHGTGVSGIIAANPYNYGGYNQGMVPNTHLVMLKQEESSDIKSALDWVITYHTRLNIQVVNLTDFATDINPNSYDPHVYDPELKQLWDLGIFVTTPVGNGESVYGPNFPIGYPALSPYVMGAGGVTQSDTMWIDGRRGPGLDILAPSSDVTMTYYLKSNNPGYSKYDDNYTGTGVLVNYAQGTSWASAYTSGAAALLKQIDQTLTPAQITSILTQSGDLVPDPENPGTSYPRLNVTNAIALAYNTADDIYGTRAHNYSLRRAYPLRIRAGSVAVSGLKLLIGRPDVWSFRQTATSTVTLGVQYSGPSRWPTCNLLNSRGIAVGAVGPRGLRISLSAGTYYLYLTAPQSLIGSYGLTVSGAHTTGASPAATPAFSTTPITPSTSAQSTDTASAPTKRRPQVFDV